MSEMGRRCSNTLLDTSITVPPENLVQRQYEFAPAHNIQGTLCVHQWDADLG